MDNLASNIYEEHFINQHIQMISSAHPKLITWRTIIYFSIAVFIIIAHLFDFDSSKYSTTFYNYWITLRENHEILLKCGANLGHLKLISVFAIFAYFSFPLSKSYSFLILISFSWYLSNLLDLIYGPRIEKDFKSYISKDGAEKPSGHCLMASGIYISLYEFIISEINEKVKKQRRIKFLSIFLFFILILIISIVVISQVLLGKHSFDMCLMGVLSGIILYFVFYFILHFQNISALNFFKIFKNNSSKVILIFAYIICDLLLFTLYFSFERKFNFITPLGLSEKDSQTSFNQNSLLQGMCINILIGGHFGLGYLLNFIKQNYPLKTNEINHFTDVPFIHKLKIFIFIFFFYCITIFLFFVINDDTPFGVAIILEIIPYFIVGYSAFGIGVSGCIQFGLGNEKIREKESSIELKNMDDANGNSDSEEKEDDDDQGEMSEEDENSSYSGDREGKKEKKVIDEDLVVVNYAKKKKLF